MRTVVAAEVVWSRLARTDLLDIYVSIGSHDPAAAERLYDRIEERARQLALQPRMGPRRPEIRPSTRILVETPFLILYETIPDTDDAPVREVEIVRVLDGRRDVSVVLHAGENSAEW
ncbi:plasmid stabilization protein [Methylobacterium sp. Leaf119]|nr:plasmid stabilization protein [Methylobacterium sp. Leaf119]